MMNFLFSSKNKLLKFLFVFLFVQVSLSALVPYSKTNNKIVFYYCYYERGEQCKENLNFFLKNALLDDVDYFFVINGTCSVTFPEKRNLFVFQRENCGYDFGGYAYLLQKFDFSGYNYHFFCNTSVKGPFLPPSMSCKKWTEPFLNLLKDDVKIVGTTINVLNGPYFDHLNSKYLHNKRRAIPSIQSMMFVIDKQCFDFLNKKDFFNFEEICRLSFEELIAYKEVNLSILILDNGWNIDCIAPKYQGKDYRLIDQDFNPTSRSGDPVYPGAYFGATLHPYDVIFFKTNRLPLPPGFLNQ